MEDEDYKESEISKKVKELMDDGYEFGEAVREALKEGFADGGSIGIEVLFKPKRQELFMGGPALTGPALNIYNSMKAYQSFTDQEIADAIKEAGYSLPTADSGTTTPPDSTPDSSNQGGNEDRNIIGGSNDTGYSPLQNVAEFQAYKDKINAEAMNSPLPQELLSLDQKKNNPAFMGTVPNPGDYPYSGPIQQFSQIGENLYDVNPLGTITGQRTYKTPRTIGDQVYAAAAKGQLGTGVNEEEDLSTFQKMKGSFNKGITSVMDSPIGRVAGLVASPPLAIAKGILSALPKSKPVGMVDGKAIYGVGSFDKFGTNAINQAALNKTGNFTNYQLGNQGDPGRVAGDPTNNVFAGMNAQSAFGDISKGAQKRIDTINKTISKMTPAQKKKSSLPARLETFKEQKAGHDAAAAKEAANKQAAKDNQSGYGGSCFIAGTKVTMADGTLKNIENVKVGDKVKGHKEENTVIKLDPTLLADRKLYSFNDNEHYFFTSEHPFMTEEGWKSIKPEKTKERDGVELYDQLKGELKVGDKLVTDNGPVEVKDIKSKEMNNPEMPLYNFNVSNDNSYIADDYVVHNKGCFLKGTLITMADGTTKPVEQVDLGDEVAVGGKVFAVGRFLNTELYDYKGIKVSGSHMVNEDGTWMRVRDTKHGKSLGDDQNTVYVFGSENRRILINDILFTDYFEIEDQEQLLKEEDKFFDNWKTFANNEDQKNVNTLNAN